MKDVIVTRHKYHIVRSLPGCTVRQEGANGTVIEATVPADEDTPVFAHSGRWTVEGDENVTVTEVFKLAPQQRLALLGVLGGNVPAWLASLKDGLTAMLDGSKFELAWLAGEKTLVVHTDRLSDDLLVAVKAAAEAAMPEGATLVQYNHNMEVSWRDINKYAECKTNDDLKAVNPDYKKDVTSDGEWVYPLPKITWKASEAFMYAPIKKVINFELPGVEHGTNYFWGGCEMDILDVSLPNYNYNGTVSTIWMCYAKHMKIRVAKTSGLCWLFSRCKAVQTAEIYAPKATNLNNMAETDWGTNYVDKLHTLTLYAPLASSAKNALPYSILTASSAVGLLDGLPTWTDGAEHFITVGIHVDHQNDEDVLAAIAAAEAKGWTLTVKWNGTPTSTASTMAMGTLIYAKVGEMERPDGTTERVLDWGHYVTNWEERGYEQFRSLESAYRYFGMEMPAEALTETE